MEATLLDIYRFFDNSSSQFYIPVFQRSYAWKAKNIYQLLNDIELLLKEVHESHFLGNVIYKRFTKSNFILKQLIDGQQRITTFFLFLNSLKNYMYNNNIVNNFVEKIKNVFLENSYVEGKYKLKLKPEVDNTDIFKLISENKIDVIKKSINNYQKNNLYINYEIIYNTVGDWFDKYGIDKIECLFSKIKLVEIVIEEKDNVDPHRIFESINSTGLDLTNLDLIRNYILMNFDDEKQEEIYNYYWKKFEIRLNNLNKKSIDKLIRILIQFIKKEYVQEKEIYSDFKEIFKNVQEKEIIKQLNHALDLYEHFYNVNIDKIDKVKYESFINLQPNKNELFSTIFMILLDKKNNSLINNETYEKSLKVLSEYILRRKVADLDTSPITRYFNQTLINKIKNENEKIAKVLYNELFVNNINTQMKAPSNNDIYNILSTSNFYELDICKVFFWYLENFKNSVHLRFKTLSIEHIAPRNPKNNSWEKEMKVKDQLEYQDYVNKMGNLTIVPSNLNSELGNNNFQDKKNLLSKYEHIKLNKKILSVDNFDKDFITYRQKLLIDEFLKIFD